MGHQGPLPRSNDFALMLVPGKKEEWITRNGEFTGAVSRGQHQCIDSSGKLSLGSVFALIHQASCVITNDSGPMHIAIAMSRPTVCFLDPGSPEHYGVRGPKVDIRYKAVVCGPCLYETDAPPCDGKNICMQIIEVDEVVNAAVRLMRDEDHGTVSRRSLAPVEAPVQYLDLGGQALGLIARASIPPRAETE